MQQVETDPQKLRENRIQMLEEFALKLLKEKGRPNSPYSLRSFKTIMQHESVIMFYSIPSYEARELGDVAAEIALRKFSI